MSGAPFLADAGFGRGAPARNDVVFLTADGAGPGPGGARLRVAVSGAAADGSGDELGDMISSVVLPACPEDSPLLSASAPPASLSGPSCLPSAEFPAVEVVPEGFVDGGRCALYQVPIWWANTRGHDAHDVQLGRVCALVALRVLSAGWPQGPPERRHLLVSGTVSLWSSAGTWRSPRGLATSMAAGMRVRGLLGTPLSW